MMLVLLLFFPVKYIEPEKVKWWFYLLVILIPILVMTLLTSLFLMYLWKRRVIVVLKAVRLFQAYEDDGNELKLNTNTYYA